MKSIRRVLVVQPYGIGDALFTTPMLRALRTLPTVEEVDLLVGSRTEEVFEANPHVDEIYSIDKGKWHAAGGRVVFQDLHRLWRDLRGRYDLLIDYSLQREYGFYGAFFLGIPRRIGPNYKSRGIFLTRSVPLQNGRARSHMVEHYCKVGKLIGLAIEEPFVEFYPADGSREKAEGLLKGKSIRAESRFIAVAPGGGESWGKDAHFKRWPAANFAGLLGLLREKIDFTDVVILGSEGERELGGEIEGLCKGSRTRATNLCGEISLGVTGALLEKSLFFLGNDGGLVHLAHALHVPLVALYGPVDPAVYGPYPRTDEAVAVARKGLPCRPCYQSFRYNTACIDRECLTALAPQDVMEALDRKDFWKVLCEK